MCELIYRCDEREGCQQLIGTSPHLTQSRGSRKPNESALDHHNMLQGQYLQLTLELPSEAQHAPAIRLNNTAFASEPV